MRTDELDFELPQNLIAQEPTTDRAGSRLMHYRRRDRSVVHRRFAELPGSLVRGDLLVFNDAQVIPARFGLIKSTGGFVEALFLQELAPRRWLVMLKNLGSGNRHAPLMFADDSSLEARVVEQLGGGEYQVEVNTDEPTVEVLHRLGRMPLPPYIKRDKHRDSRDAADRQRYQTVYARASGAVAAPTAGLHFTDDMFRQLDDRGIERCFVTLHVGAGTFRPINAANLDQHQMHRERYVIDARAAKMINAARDENRRIIAVGTTSARVLESQPRDRPIQPRMDSTDIFIYSPYDWKRVGALITNFHLPRSTLIALVAAMIGLDEQRRLYQLAISEKYRFFSYGDAMFIE